jgi:hypothetical protein
MRRRNPELRVLWVGAQGATWFPKPRSRVRFLVGPLKMWRGRVELASEGLQRSENSPSRSGRCSISVVEWASEGHQRSESPPRVRRASDPRSGGPYVRGRNTMAVSSVCTRGMGVQITSSPPPLKSSWRWRILGKDDRPVRSRWAALWILRTRC